VLEAVGSWQDAALIEGQKDDEEVGCSAFSRAAEAAGDCLADNPVESECHGKGAVDVVADSELIEADVDKGDIVGSY
jgi:hypothetical protein